MIEAQEEVLFKVCPLCRQQAVVQRSTYEHCHHCNATYRKVQVWELRRGMEVRLGRYGRWYKVYTAKYMSFHRYAHHDKVKITCVGGTEFVRCADNRVTVVSRG